VYHVLLMPTYCILVRFGMVARRLMQMQMQMIDGEIARMLKGGFKVTQFQNISFDRTPFLTESLQKESIYLGSPSGMVEAPRLEGEGGLVVLHGKDRNGVEEEFSCLMPLFFVSYFYGLVPSDFETINLSEDFFSLYPPFCGLQCLRDSSYLLLPYLRDGTA
jgi:hypothetical protein